MPQFGTETCMSENVICTYCGRDAALVTGWAIYPHRRDLEHKIFYLCKPCEAWVGVHDGTEKPLGRLANKELRFWKQRAHSVFDPMWKLKNRRSNRKDARGKAYKWLAERLGVDPDGCHIGQFDIEQCKRVVEICEPIFTKIEHHLRGQNGQTIR